MLKKIIIGIGILIGIIVILAGIGMYYFQPDENIVLDFIKDNPDKAAIKLIKNDSLIAEENPDKIMPLASTVKIILAIEYAEQASQEIINPDQKIPLDEIEKFYIPNTDGGAHPAWLKSVKDKTVDHEIPIREIAKGMIRYSSNANTEWLCKKLGLENINNRLDSLGVSKHSEIYFIVSALFVGKEKFPDSEGSALATKLKNLSMEEYINITNEVHDKLLADTIYKKDIGDLGMNIQRIWSDNLPGSTVKEYVGIMKKINSRAYFNPKTQEYLEEVIELPSKSLEHLGMKGGSTAFILTKALYATDKKGNKIELAYFFNDLNPIQNTRLQMSMTDFERKVLKDEAFRNKIEQELNH